MGGLGKTHLLMKRPPLEELTHAIDGVRETLNVLKAVIAVMPEDERCEVITTVFSAVQALGDLYAEFAMDMLRMLAAQGNA